MLTIKLGDFESKDEKGSVTIVGSGPKCLKLKVITIERDFDGESWDDDVDEDTVFIKNEDIIAQSKSSVIVSQRSYRGQVPYVVCYNNAAPREARDMDGKCQGEKYEAWSKKMIESQLDVPSGARCTYDGRPIN